MVFDSVKSYRTLRTYILLFKTIFVKMVNQTPSRVDDRGLKQEKNAPKITFHVVRFLS